MSSPKSVRRRVEDRRLLALGIFQLVVVVVSGVACVRYDVTTAANVIFVCTLIEVTISIWLSLKEFESKTAPGAERSGPLG